MLKNIMRNMKRIIFKRKIHFSLCTMKALYKREFKNEKITDWSDLVEHMKDELKKISIERLEKEKLETEANLEHCEQHNENVIIKYGLPIVSLVFSTLSLLFSLVEKVDVQTVEKITDHLINIIVITAVFYIFGEICRNTQRKNIIYYKTKLRIIESIK